MDEKKETIKALDRYLSPLDVWAMAFGVMVGWGAFAERSPCPETPSSRWRDPPAR